MTDDLNKRSEELDRKEAEIARREQELNNQTGRQLVVVTAAVALVYTMLDLYSRAA